MTMPKKKRLRAIADRLWSLAVRADWGACAVCGGRKCDAHHLVPRQNEATRYELINGIALCQYHHKFDAKLSPHQNAAGWMSWLEDHHNDQYHWYMLNRHPEFTGSKTVEYYLALIQYFSQYVEPAEFQRVVGIRLSRWLEDAAEERINSA